MNVLEFTKKELTDLPAEERELLLLLGHIANELSVLNKLHYWSSLSVKQDGVRGQAGTMQTLVAARLLAGKLLEAWDAIRTSYFKSRLSQKYDQLITEDARQALKACKRYFNSTNGIFQTRNNFGFHYSPEEVHIGFDHASPEEKFCIYITEARGNCLYYASEVVFGTANASMVGSGDAGLGIRQLLGDLDSVASSLQTFMDECISAIIFAHFGHAEDRLRIEVVPGAPDIDTVRIPYFVVSPESRDDS